jgi:MinD-like ATPase involved in chromosome partitioning or flagellar assembly
MTHQKPSPLPILVAIAGADHEMTIIAGLENSPQVEVVRRCFDMADLLTAASVNYARVAIVAGQLRRFDREAVYRLRGAGVAVVELVSLGAQAEPIRDLGVDAVVSVGADVSEIIAVAIAAAMQAPTVVSQHSDQIASSRVLAQEVNVGRDEVTGDSGNDKPGTMIAVWGPTGAPGRSTFAVNAAGELARRGCTVVLADVDVYGGSVDQILGILDEVPGLVAACRLANSGGLTVERLAAVAPVALPGLRVLTGLSRPDRWPELKPSALEPIWDMARKLASFTIVDCAFCLELDPELPFDSRAARRNGATVATLAQADVVVAVGAADPVGIHRLIRGLNELRDVLPEIAPHVILNRLPSGHAGRQQYRQAVELVASQCGINVMASVPEDRESCTAAVAAGRLLSEVRPDSPTRRAISDIAASVARLPTINPAPWWSLGRIRAQGKTRIYWKSSQSPPTVKPTAAAIKGS